MARFTLKDVLLLMVAGAVVLMWGQVPRYQDWHWNLDLVPLSNVVPPDSFKDRGREAPFIPTPFRAIDYENGFEMYRGGYSEGFATAVDDFLNFGLAWEELEAEDANRLPSEQWDERHFDVAYHAGYSRARVRIENLLADHSVDNLQRRLDRDHSYRWKLVYPIAVSLLLGGAVGVRFVSLLSITRNRIT